MLYVILLTYLHILNNGDCCNNVLELCVLGIAFKCNMLQNKQTVSMQPNGK